MGLLLIAATNAAIAQSIPPTPPTAAAAGIASFYGNEFRGKPMANGLPFNPDALTAASRVLPLGTRVLITNLHNGRQAYAIITDRGPYKRGRSLDVSLATARLLGMEQNGLAPVYVLALDEARPSPHLRRRAAHFSAKAQPRSPHHRKWSRNDIASGVLPQKRGL
jgi:rare lipoprotein A